MGALLPRRRRLHRLRIRLGAGRFGIEVDHPAAFARRLRRRSGLELRRDRLILGILFLAADDDPIAGTEAALNLGQAGALKSQAHVADMHAVGAVESVDSSLLAV